ncbi:hypothetical protein APSETT444_005080 [Aspergillus pseudonomiae]
MTSTDVHTVTPTKSVSSKQSTFETSTTTTSRLETTSTPGTTTASTTSTSEIGTGTSAADNANADAETGHGTPVGAIVGGVIAPTKKEKAETSSLLTPTDYSTNGTTPISPTSTAAELDAFHLYPPQTPYTLFTHPNASIPELSGTGVHSPRAELAAQPSRELINIPRHQRQPSNQSSSSQGPTRAELAAQPCRELINVPHHRRQHPATLPTSSREQVDETMTRANSPPVITADGVVLSANFDTSASGSDVLSSHGLSSSHAMSFMDYDTARKSMLSAHRPEWADSPGEGKTDKPKGRKHMKGPE